MMIDEATKQRIQAQLGDPKLASHYLKPDQMAWQPTEFPGIEMKLLCRDEARGMSTILFRMAPGGKYACCARPGRRLVSLDLPEAQSLCRKATGLRAVNQPLI
jgi:hypothetical protein